MSPEHSNNTNDKPLALPMRKPSFSTSFTAILMAQTRQFSRLSSSSSGNQSTCPILYSPDSSTSCMDSFTKDTLRSSSSFFLSLELISSDFEDDDSVESSSTTDITERGVPYAPSPTTRIITGMCLEDYTQEEIDNCWYSREDIRCMRKQDNRRKNKCRRGHDEDCARWKA